MPSRRDWLRASALGAAGIVLSRRIVGAEPLPVVAVYKDPGCECCARWVKHLSANGFVATVRDSTDMPSVKRTMGVPDALQSCHTAVVGKYVVEGHVPAAAIKKLARRKANGHGSCGTGHASRFARDGRIDHSNLTTSLPSNATVRLGYT
jgi:hypothetical protein